MYVCVRALTTQVLQDEVELPPRLEGVDQVHDEGMLHLLQDAPLGLRVRRVLGVADNHGLAGSDGAPNRQVSVMTSKRQALTRGKKKKAGSGKRREDGAGSTVGQEGAEAEKIYHLVANSIPYLPLPHGGARF